MRFLGPSAPLDLKVVKVLKDSIEVQWQAPQYPNGIIKKYSVSTANLVCFE